MCRFIETIHIECGRIYRLDYHIRRMAATMHSVFGKGDAMCLPGLLVPEKYKERTRCRIEYYDEIRKIEYIPYHIRPVRSLKLVADDEIDYSLKSVDRSSLDRLFGCRGQADEILIVKNGLLTDTSIANIALWDGYRWSTPRIPLLAGTNRQYLLDNGIIHEADIRADDLGNYSKIRLFNAMIEFGEVELDCRMISFV